MPDEKFIDGLLLIMESLLVQTRTPLLPSSEMKLRIESTNNDLKPVLRVLRPLTDKEIDLFCMDMSRYKHNREVSAALKAEGVRTWEEVPGGGLFPMTEALAELLIRRYWDYLMLEAGCKGEGMGLRVIDGQLVFAVLNPALSQHNASDTLAQFFQKILFAGEAPDLPPVPKPEVPTVFTTETDAQDFDLGSWVPSKGRAN